MQTRTNIHKIHIDTSTVGLQRYNLVGLICRNSDTVRKKERERQIDSQEIRCFLSKGRFFINNKTQRAPLNKFKYYVHKIYAVQFVTFCELTCYLHGFLIYLNIVYVYNII